MTGADLTDVDIVDGDGEITANIEFVAAANDDAVQSGKGWFTDVAQALVALDEFAHPLPIIARAADKGFLLLEISTSAECSLAVSGEHNYTNTIIPTGIFEGNVEFLQHAAVDGVQYLRAVESDGGATVAL